MMEWKPEALATLLAGSSGPFSRCLRDQPARRGVTLGKLANIFIQLGAHKAINLDGGGSTSLVINDPGTGAFAIANQPSDLSMLKLPVRGERPVVDVLGIRVR